MLRSDTPVAGYLLACLLHRNACLAQHDGRGNWTGLDWARPGWRPSHSLVLLSGVYYRLGGWVDCWVLLLYCEVVVDSLTIWESSYSHDKATWERSEVIAKCIIRENMTGELGREDGKLEWRCGVKTSGINNSEDSKA
ncbi:hypothetical protein VTJ04DRAFT_96 [Mycothermus thermophilus]|uniref:uncharacterized protein n=1 Tax=Humicola insolens TaxID=85995 RepID=UPI003743CEB3